MGFKRIYVLTWIKKIIVPSVCHRSIEPNDICMIWCYIDRKATIDGFNKRCSTWIGIVDSGVDDIKFLWKQTVSIDYRCTPSIGFRLTILFLSSDFLRMGRGTSKT